MSVTPLSICQDACRLLGANPPESFDDGSLEAEVCLAVYEDTIQSELSSRAWRFATKEQLLEQLDETSDYGFNYVLAIPNDVVKIFSTIDTARFRVEQQQLHSHDRTVNLIYTFYVPEAFWPRDFVMAMKYAIAKEISFPITGNTTRTQFFEKKYKTLRNEAAYNDSQGTITKAVRKYSFINVRGGASRSRI